VTADWRTFLDTALLFVVLINPASKVALLVALPEQHRPEDLVRVAWRASVAGLLLLAVFAAAGGWVLRYLLHVELYALDVAAGAVLFLVGLATLVRILGLFIASIGANMFLAGIQVWFAQLPKR
jgi:small neutral amino acid transporter SnatA (MarC family)